MRHACLVPVLGLLASSWGAWGCGQTSNVGNTNMAEGGAGAGAGVVSADAGPALSSGTGGLSAAGSAGVDAGTPGLAGASSTAGASGAAGAGSVTLRADVQEIREVADARAKTFIPPYLDCRDPKPGETGAGPNGQVCTHVAISGCTEPGKYFPDYGSCDVVRTQRPFWPKPPAAEPRADDPRLNDTEFMSELAWVTREVEACGCVCCHDSQANNGQAGQWDIRRGPIWLDTLADTGLALFVGLADSSVLGAYPRADNFGFDRTDTGLPTSDTARMKRFLEAEMQRRSLTTEEAAAVPPFGGPIYENSIRKPGVCKDDGNGIAADGRVIFSGTARYVYVLDQGSKNPGVPPNLDLPEGTLWRLDVLASAEALVPGFTYGTTPAGSFQAFPEQTAAPALELGKSYQLTVLRDVGVPVANCTFVYGEEPPPPPPMAAAGSGAAGMAGSAGMQASAGTAAPSGTCTLPGGDADGFSASCQTNAECTCKADYCALMPGQSAGVCTVQNCKAQPGICPTGFSCFDLSAFGPDLPSICTMD